MGVLSNSTIAKYVRTIKSSPKELIWNRKLLVTAALFAMSGIPISTLTTPLPRPMMRHKMRRKYET
jgi:hypothetical protein